MMNYDRFWATLKASNETTYTLTRDRKISMGTLSRLRHNLPLNTTTINDLCRALDCRVEDIMEYVPSEEDQAL